tara:strand:+ start:31 stop:171 length:141 start_codon:yes stop_codon:yes gene_type:complete
MDKMDRNQKSKGAKPKEKINPHIRARNCFLNILLILKFENVLRKLI